jgi:hypothetical protein
VPRADPRGPRLGIPVREGRWRAAACRRGRAAAPARGGALALDAAGGWRLRGRERRLRRGRARRALQDQRLSRRAHRRDRLALLAGAKAQSLPESQYGLASIQFRWNVSGTYMQVIPRFISTAADGKSDPREFLRSVLR